MGRLQPICGLVLIAHLAVAGKEAEGAAAGDGEHATNALGGGLGKIGLKLQCKN